MDRAFWSLLYRIWPGCPDAVVIVNTDHADDGIILDGRQGASLILQHLLHDIRSAAAGATG